jgi:hypothetical protein
MSRIRSVHPGFFTDESVVSVSMTARVCVIGLGVESDDKGIFEWKPLQLKMRLFPADNVDMAETLAELEAVDIVRRFSIQGKWFGAIRNFRKFQKPKTPNDVHPITDEIRNYVGLTGDISETGTRKRDAFPHNGEPFPPKGEKSFQMEDGGGKGEEESPLPPKAKKRSEPDGQPAEPDDRVSQLMHAGGFVSMPSDTGLLGQWVKDGAGFDEHILPAFREIGEKQRERSGKPPFRFKFFDDAVRARMAEADAERARWRAKADESRRRDEREAKERAADAERDRVWKIEQAAFIAEREASAVQ